MYVCLHVYIYIYIHIYTYVYIYTHASSYTQTHTRTHTHIYIYIYKQGAVNESQQHLACATRSFSTPFTVARGGLTPLYILHKHTHTHSSKQRQLAEYRRMRNETPHFGVQCPPRVLRAARVPPLPVVDEVVRVNPPSTRQWRHWSSCVCQPYVLNKYSRIPGTQPQEYE